MPSCWIWRTGEAGETPIPLGPDSHFVLIKDPDGTFVELIGPLK